MADQPRLRHRIEAVIAARVIWLVPRWRRLLLDRHAREQQYLRAPCPGSPDGAHYERGRRFPVPGLPHTYVTGILRGGGRRTQAVTPPEGASWWVSHDLCPEDQNPLRMPAGICPLCGVMWTLHYDDPPARPSRPDGYPS
jgi:hypothetical protein